MSAPSVLRIDHRHLSGVIFDCDGVLLKSNHIKTRAFYELALPFGEVVAEAFVEYHQEHGGISRFEKVRYLLSEFVGVRDVERESPTLLERYGQLVMEKLLDAEELPGIREILNQLTNSRVQNFVASGGKQDELVEVLSAKGLASHFSDICGAPTPKAEIVSGLLQRFELEPRRSLLFGDSRLDFDIACRHDIPFVMVWSVSEWDGWEQERSKMLGAVPSFEAVEITPS